MHFLTKQLVQLPRVTFSTIYEFLVDRKVILPKVSYLENIADIQAKKSIQNDVVMFYHVMKFLACRLSILEH